ncbi:MAG: hypothetical protein H7Z40_16550 [Phycisphaerae bacterium]|nr:hypothetical protein [Gemmatimonadaceae bacterium]
MPSRSFPLLLVMFCGACAPTAQPASTPGTKTSPDLQAAEIDGAFPMMRKDTAIVLELSTEGARLEAAYSDSTLRRLRAEYLGETGRATDTFYFDSVLFLVVRGSVSYDAPLSGHAADSTTTRFDLRSDSTPPSQRDSLRAAARTLLVHIASAQKR